MKFGGSVLHITRKAFRIEACSRASGVLYKDAFADMPSTTSGPAVGCEVYGNRALIEDKGHETVHTYLNQMSPRDLMSHFSSF